MPIQGIIFPAIAIVVAVAYLIYQRVAVNSMDAQYSTYRAGEMAQRLGLELLEGDPEFNLFIQQANVDIRRGPSDGRPLHVQLCMRGAPHGVPLEFVYLYRIEQERSFAEVTWTVWFECTLSGAARQAFPPFEVITRNAPLGPISTRQALPPMASGDPRIDGTYAISTHEPAMARVLAEALPGFGVFHNAGIHLVGDGHRVAFHMRLDKAPLMANTLYFAEQMSALLTDLTRRVGG